MQRVESELASSHGMRTIDFAGRSVDSAGGAAGENCPVPDRLLHALYEAAIDGAQWKIFLAALSERIGGHASSILLFFSPPDNNVNLDRVHGISAELVRRYATRDYANDAVIRGLSRFEVGTVFCEEDCFDSRENMLQAPIWKEWFAPQRIDSILGMVIFEGAPYRPSLFVFGNSTDTPFAADAREVLAALLPHLQRALRIHRELLRARVQDGVVRDVLSRLPVGVVQLDMIGTVLFMNEVAGEIMMARRGFRIVGGKLRCTDSEDTRALVSTVASMAELAEQGDHQAHSYLSIGERELAAPLTMLITPLRRTEGLRTEGADVLAFIYDPQRSAGLHVEDAQAVLGVTPAQARVAVLLAKGLSIEEISQTLALSIHTVRNRVKQVLAQTGSARQSEIVRRLLMSVAQLRHRASR